MRKLTKYLFGIVMGIMTFGMTAFAAEYTVTPFEGAGYTTENTTAYISADMNSAMIWNKDQCPDNIGIYITGFTSNGFWEVDLGQPQKFYIAGADLVNVVGKDGNTADINVLVAQAAEIAKEREGKQAEVLEMLAPYIDPTHPLNETEKNLVTEWVCVIEDLIVKAAANPNTWQDSAPVYLNVRTDYEYAYNIVDTYYYDQLNPFYSIFVSRGSWSVRRNSAFFLDQNGKLVFTP